MNQKCIKYMKMVMKNFMKIQINTLKMILNIRL